MKKIVLGNNTGAPSSLIIHRGIRVGDLACLHVMLGHWRQANPDRRLYYFYNPFIPFKQFMYGQFIPMEWVFGQFADEIWLGEALGEYPNDMPGEVIFDIYSVAHPRLHTSAKKIHMWDFWRKYHFSRTFIPTIKPPADIQAKADELLKKHGVPEKFVAIQPLIDAGYHTYRNAPIKWWEDVCDACVMAKLPVAILGCPKVLKDFKTQRPVFKLYEDCPNIFDSLALANRATVLVGGETGFPLWSAIFGVTTIFTVPTWSPGGGPNPNDARYDYRPISFGKPVIFAKLRGIPLVTAQIIQRAFQGVEPSTPVK